MHFLSSLGLFTAEALVILAVILLALTGILALFAKSKKAAAELDKLSIINLNEKFRDQQQELLHKVDEKKAKSNAKKSKKKKNSKAEEKRLYLIDFDGDVKCSGVEQLRHQVTATLQLARQDLDEVLIRIKSGGGMVHTYGLAASQCQRVREAGINLTVAIDQVAASGGYLMAATAHNIIAAPFAIIGSIGVVMQLPNFNKWLKKHNVDVELLTAGEYKRTLTMIGENDAKARKKCQEEINETHTLFKDFVKRARPQLDLEKVATGEHWYGTQALELGLVDKLQTSDDYICDRLNTHASYQIKCTKKKNLKERLGNQAHALLQLMQSGLETMLGHKK
jgi:serine protease SohB